MKGNEQFQFLAHFIYFLINLITLQVAAFKSLLQHENKKGK